MFTTIIWATDSSEHSTRALPYAIAMAERDHAQLHVVHIIEKLTGGRIAGQYTFLNEEQREAAIKAQAAEIRAEHQLDVKLHLVLAGSGHVARRIADVGEELGADLIVVGTHGHSALAGALLGSVTQQLLHEASCPVLAIPRMQAAEAEPVSEPASTTA